MKKSELKKRLVEALTPDEASKVDAKYKEIYAGMVGKNPLKMKKYDNPDKVAYGRAINLIQKESLKLAEKLGKTADVGDYKDDFRKSDAPQFKGKSKKKRDQMATAAFLNKEEKTLEEIDNLMNETGQEIAKKNMDDYKRLNELVKAALMGPMNEKKQRPDYPDIDGDGDTKEPMVKALKDKEKSEANEDVVKGSNIKKVGDKYRVLSGKTGKMWKQKYDSKKDAEAALRGYFASQNESLSERILKELRGSINEMAGEDLELKSLAKKFIPIFKKYGMRVDYKTDTKSIEMKPKVNAGNVPATLIISKQDDGKGGFGMLTVAVYWLSLVSAKNDKRLGLQELDMGSGPSKQDYKDADEMANKIYKELMAVVPKGEFDSIAPPKMNRWGNYLIHFRLKK